MLYKVLVLILLSTSLSFGQFELDVCPSTTDCLTGNKDFFVEIPIPEGTDSEVESCDGQSFSQMNYAFEANFESMVVVAEWQEPESVKMGLVLGCYGAGECIVEVTCTSEGVLELVANNLEVGKKYVLYIDGCNHDEVIVADIGIYPGPLTELFYGLDNMNLSQECSESNEEFCPGEINIEIFSEELEYWNDRMGDWYFHYWGEEEGEFIVNSLYDISFEVFEVGSYVLCLDHVTFDCIQLYQTFCFEFSIIEEQVVEAEYDVCAHELRQGFWVPFEGWEGDIIDEAGEYEYRGYTECGCYLDQLVVVNEIPEEEAEVIIELCPQDYPYDFLGEEEYDYSQTDIEDLIYLDEGSLLEDYDGNPCDSIIYLILVNEAPQTRCSSCNLPLSLEKGKIVVCLPFDNGTVDVSGRNTIVRPFGIDYDDNGSKENDFWEALLDGKDDYVEIPHIDDLNTSVFSVNFQFNKDERFENGPIETLVSKGDAGSGNLRFNIQLEKVNESKFNLKGNFFGSTNTFELGHDDLQNNVWYDVAYVVETDSISLYLNGYLEKTISVDQSLRGNTESMYLGTQVVDAERSMFYNGRLDNFKYWKQKLSGQDVLYLHFPEKEFEVKQQYFLSCCEEATFRDVTIDINNKLDSLVVANASPTGYDSVYILSFIQNDTPPQINNDLVPEDVIVSYQQQCEEFCSAVAVWDDPSSELFSDNCEILTISQSHTSPLVLDENISFVEVSYTATDICGQSNTISFGLELECLPSMVEAIPENNTFVLEANDQCIDSNENSICKFSDILFVPGFVDNQSGSLELYSEANDFDITLAINGVAKQMNTKDSPNGLYLPELKEEGTYDVCIQMISNECNTVVENYCQTVNVRGSTNIDHGTVVACPENFEEVLPEAISGELKNLILSNPQETTVSISNEDDCGCIDTEVIKIELATPKNPEELIVEACPDMFPINILGLEINEGDVYNQTVLRFENASLTQNSLGSHCDSLISLTVIKKENVFENFVVEICDGEVYDDHDQSGTYTYRLDANNGCDSIVVLDLIVHPKSFTELFIELCPDSTYMGYSEEGEYELFDINVLGCDSLTTLNIIMLDENDPTCMTSSQDQALLNQISIWPNPVKETLRIESISMVDQNMSVSILDVSGKLVKMPVKNSKSIDVSDLSQGIYLLKVVSEGKDIGVKRFLKM